MVRCRAVGQGEHLALDRSGPLGRRGGAAEFKTPAEAVTEVAMEVDNVKMASKAKGKFVITV